MADELPGPLLQTVLLMQAAQEQRALRRVNMLANTCFDACVNDFSLTRQLGSTETSCIHMCTQKYLAFSAVVGQSFLNSLADDPRFKPM